MSDYYGSVDYSQGYGNYSAQAGAGFPPAGAPPASGQWSQGAPPANPNTAPAGYPPAGAPPDAHYPAYPPPQQYRPPMAGAGAPPPPYNAAPAYGQPPQAPYGQPAVPPPGAANGAPNYGVPPPIAPPAVNAPYGVPPAAYGSRPPPTGYPDDLNARPNFRGPPPGTGRTPGPGFNKGYGDRRGGYGGHGMEEQKDTIFVSGLPDTTTEEQLQEFFGSIGLIKMDKRTNKPKIWIYRDKLTQKPKGEVTITYDDPVTATSAIDWFNEKDFYGSTIKVELAQRKASNFESRSYGRDARGPPGGRREGPPGERDNRTQIREGDWRCPNDECNNNNFAWRNECNRCKAPKPEDAGGDRRGSGPPPFSSDRRGGPGSRSPYGGPGGFRESRGGYSRGGPPRGGGAPFGERSRPPHGAPRSGGRDFGRGGGPMRGLDSRRAAPY